MRRILLVAMTALAACCAGAEQKSTPVAKAGAMTASASASAKKAQTVTVYMPRKPVLAPRLLPPAEPMKLPKHCEDTSVGESVLSLLVDTNGRPRNVMFLNPSGSLADRVAIAIVEGDRFAPATLNGTPVVVAETLDVTIKACLAKGENAAGKMTTGWVFKSTPRQKLKKPKNPPQVAELAPLKTPRKEFAQKVTRPDFFGNGETAPVLLYSDYASYTPSHPWLSIKGTCKVSMVVDAHGLPQDLHVLKKLDPGLDRSALTAVLHYRFFPAIKNDEPVPAAVVVSVKFAPPGR
jgi:TonB family protein